MFRRYNTSFKNKAYNDDFRINRNKEKKKMLLDIYSNIHMQNNKINKELYCYIDCLKEILNDNLSLDSFAQWFCSLINQLEQKNLTIEEFLNNLYFLKNDEILSTKFFNYCYKLYNSRIYKKNSDFSRCCEIAECIYNKNLFDSICFITPDIGMYPCENKIGEIISDLSKGLTELGLDIIIISPYYHCYNLKKYPFNNFSKINQISIQLDVNYNFDIYLGEKNGFQYYFIYNPNLFKIPHPSLTGVETIREISCFSKASLQLLVDLNLIPEVIITNDAYTGFVPAYARNNSFKEIFQNTKLVHLCNDLENQGKIYLSLKEGTYEDIHKLLNDIVTDPYDQRLVNPTSCALRMCDQWAVLSRAYHNNLLKNSQIFNLFNLLKEKKGSIFISSGISKEEKFKIIMSGGGDKEDAKNLIQRKYFCYKINNPQVPLYSFIGKLNEQNGALLLLDIVEKLCKETNNKINILIIGNGDINDPYFQVCLKKINYLKKNYPFCIYIEPSGSFCKDDIYLFLKGSDFGLIPFLYDNWMNLHYKYFITGTPVIGYGVGHIKDAVKEFNYNNMTGNGFLFDHFNSMEFYLAIKNSLDLFKNKKLLEICRRNCEESVTLFDEVCLDLCRELCKLNNKIFFNNKDIYNNKYPIKNKEKCSKDKYFKNKRVCNSSKKNGNKCKEVLYDSNHFTPDYSEFGKNVKRVSSCKSCLRGNNNNCPSQCGDIYTISYRLDYPQPEKVQITGSYDGWSTLKDLKYNMKTQKWEINLRLTKGKYLYKFLVDDKCWKVNPLEHYHKEYNGMVNNVLYIV